MRKIILIVALLFIPVLAMAGKVGTFGVPNTEGVSPLEVDRNRNVTLASDATLNIDGRIDGDVDIDGELYVDGYLYGNGSQLSGVLKTEADTLATVTSRGASTSTVSSFTGGVKVGTLPNYSEIESDGTIYSYGAATTFEDLRFPANALASGAVPADICNVVGSTLRTRCFDGSATSESLEASVQLPHARKVNSLLYPHVHWGPSNTDAGNVKWQLEYSCANVNGTFPASTTISVVDASDTIAHKHQIADFPNIDTSLYGNISSMCMVRIFRNPGDGSDTYASDAELYELDFHYEVDTMGSHQEYVK